MIYAGINKLHIEFLKNNLNDLVPFSHPNMDKWRDPLHHGLMIKFKNIILTGGIDDIWQNTKTKELIIVDYKSKQALNQLKQNLI